MLRRDPHNPSKTTHTVPGPQPWLLAHVAVFHCFQNKAFRIQLNIQKRLFLQSTAGKITCTLKELGAGENLLGVCVCGPEKNLGGGELSS